MNIYLAGWQAATDTRIQRVITEGGLTHRCLSFANMVKIPGLPYYLPHGPAQLQTCLDNNVGIMMDSGVYSYRTYKKGLEAKGKGDKIANPDEFIKLYVKYCKQGGKGWNFYVTVDFERNAAANLKTHLQLEKLGIRPMPVYHGDDELSYLQRYADKGYTYICLSNYKPYNAQRRYLDAVFNMGEKLKLTYHGLGITTPWLMMDFPWRSVDSSSWSRAAGYGSIIRYDEQRNRISTVHVSVRDSAGSIRNLDLLKKIRLQVEAEGYDWKELREDMVVRHCYNAKTMVNLAKAITKRHTGNRWQLLF